MSNYSDRPTPDLHDTPGAWPETPATTRGSSYLSSRNASYRSEVEGARTPIGPAVGTAAFGRLPAQGRGSYGLGSSAPEVEGSGGGETPAGNVGTAIPPAALATTAEVVTQRTSNPTDSSDASTAVPSPEERHVGTEHPAHEEVEESPVDAYGDEKFAAIKAGPSDTNGQRPLMDRQRTEDDLFRTLSRRKSNRSGGMSRAPTQDPHDLAEQEEINRLMSRMFGKTRQENSEEEKTRHVGVVWKGLTVKGMGLGAALQPTAGDIFLGLPRFLKSLVSKGPKKAGGKPPVRKIINDFNGCIRPGEMLLVLGRPGAGCSTFLKIIGNQRFGYEVRRITCGEFS